MDRALAVRHEEHVADDVEGRIARLLHNDTSGPTRDGAAQAADASVATIEWATEDLG